jgi:hypothetical protein
MTKNELIGVIDTCWAAACEAKMPGANPMLLGATPFGLQQTDGVRMLVFQVALTAALAPRQMNVRHEQVDPDAGAPWRG